MKVKSLSRVRLLATPWTVAHQAPPSMGFSRQEYWSGVPLPSPVKKTKQKANKQKQMTKLSLLYSSSFLLRFNHYFELHAYPSYECSLNLFCRYCYGSNVCLPRIPHTPCFCNVFAGILISKVMVLEEAFGRSLSAEGWHFHDGISALMKKTLRTSPEVQWLGGLSRWR